MLIWRLILGTLFIAALGGLCWWDDVLAARCLTPAPGMALFPVAILLVALATGELVSLLAAQGRRPTAWVMYAGNLSIVGSMAIVVYWPLSGHAYPIDCPIGKLGWPLLAMAGGTILALVDQMRRYEEPGHSVVGAALAVFGMAYVGLLMSFVILLRIGGDRAGTLVPLASLVIVVKSCDVGAYTFGRLFGRHKLAPVVSPGKTVEGAVGGVFLACVGAYVVFYGVFPDAATTNGMRDGATVHPGTDPGGGLQIVGWNLGPLVYGAVVGMAGMLGDLAESLIKRDVGRKDSSTWMPGFGGVLDLIDSVLLAAPVAYGCWVLAAG